MSADCPTLDEVEAMPVAVLAALSDVALAALVEDMIVLAERCRTIREHVLAGLAMRHQIEMATP